MISAPSEGTPNSSNQAAKLEITSELRKFTPKSVQWKNTGGLKQKHKKQPWSNVECFAFGGATVRFASLETSFHATNHTIPPPPSHEGYPFCPKDKNRSPFHGAPPLMITWFLGRRLYQIFQNDFAWRGRDTSRSRQMIDIQYGITIMGGREVSRPYRVWFFAEGECFLCFCFSPLVFFH